MIPILFFGLSLMTTVNAFELKLNFKNLRNTKATIKYLVFTGSTGFPDDPSNAIKQGSFEASKASEGITLELGAGTYAISFIHDENNNNKLDTNFMGIPKEGFGFSSNPYIFFGPPSFKKASFELTENQTLSIEMRYF